MNVRVTLIDPLLTIYKGCNDKLLLHNAHIKYRTVRYWDWEWVEMVKWNGPFRWNRSNREKWSTSKGGPIFSKLFRLGRTNPFRLRPKFPEILVEWIAPIETRVDVWENEKCCGNSSRRWVFPQLFRVWLLGYFTESFSNKRKGFFFLLLSSCTCSMPRQGFLYFISRPFTQNVI